MKKAVYIISGVAFLIALIVLILISNISPFKMNEPLKILFIGNSYTFNNDLPQQVKEMRIDRTWNLSIEIKVFTPGGAKLEDHLNSSFTLDTIGDGNWDIIVIQGHSLEPLMNPIGFINTATDFIRIAKESAPDVYLFETWARAEGNTIYSETWSGGNPESMQEQLSLKYNEIAQNTNAMVIPIGSIWQKVMKENQDIELHSSDGSHPSQIGSYLTACIIYNYIFNEDPEKIKYIPPAVKKSEALKARHYALKFARVAENSKL